MIGGTATNIFFCVFYARSDWVRKTRLKTSQAMYVNDLWVAMLNKRLLAYKLKNAQDKILGSVGKIDCNSHVMEPIKYEYRNRVRNY